MARATLFAAAVLLALASAGCGGSGDGAHAGPVAVSMQGLRFHPASVVVHVGQPVKWTNNDAVDHNVTAVSGTTLKSQAFGHGASFRFLPTQPGRINYVCTLHPGMNGTIVIRK